MQQWESSELIVKSWPGPSHSGKILDVRWWYKKWWWDLFRLQGDWWRGNHMFQTFIPFWADFSTVSSNKCDESYVEEEEKWKFGALGLFWCPKKAERERRANWAGNSESIEGRKVIWGTWVCQHGTFPDQLNVIFWEVERALNSCCNLFRTYLL